jgi:hypothetical protein
MVRQAYHPEPSRRANHNDQSLKSQTIFVWDLKQCILRFIWNLIFVICDFRGFIWVLKSPGY